MHANVPGELKYLIICYQNAHRLPSFNMAVQRILETHPGLAQLAATLYNERKITDGLDTLPPTDSGENPGDHGTISVAALFLG
jgi:hypothetical protein